MEYLIIDEHQRVWTLDLTNDSLKELLSEYGGQHGRLSRAVQSAFSRHERVALLRLLVYRCVHGERINLAARALALGPLPPSGRRASPRPAFPAMPLEEMQAVLDLAEARHDEQTLAALVEEAEVFRQRGYVD